MLKVFHKDSTKSQVADQLLKNLSSLSAPQDATLLITLKSKWRLVGGC